MKLSVIYDSKTGNTKQAAEWIAEGMNSLEGVEAKAFSISSVDDEFVTESKGVVIGSPSYVASLTPDLHAWLLSSAKKYSFAGKLGGAFATEQYTHGGGSLVLQEILTMEMVFGMLCYSGGNSFGKPVIHLGPVGVNNNVEEHNGMEQYKDCFEIYGKRFATKAMELLDK
ncbi:MAG: flavodoxin family protein [Lachnospiraceae bacterium]|nr:flavodoxin family protein [Candidatus Equihabitans merdae]